MRKQIWLKHGGSGNVIELRIRDSGSTFEKIIFDPANSKDYAKAIRSIRDKYGWFPKFKKAEIEDLMKESDDTDWLDPDVNF